VLQDAKRKSKKIQGGPQSFTRLLDGFEYFACLAESHSISVPLAVGHTYGPPRREQLAEERGLRGVVLKGYFLDGHGVCEQRNTLNHLFPGACWSFFPGVSDPMGNGEKSAPRSLILRLKLKDSNGLQH
jgi:hypothetical protein